MTPTITRLSRATITAMRLALTLARTGARYEFGRAVILCNDGSRITTKKAK